MSDRLDRPRHPSSTPKGASVRTPSPRSTPSGAKAGTSSPPTSRTPSASPYAPISFPRSCRASPGEPLPRFHNFLDGEWRAPRLGELRGPELARRRPAQALRARRLGRRSTVELAVAAADRAWKSAALGRRGRSATASGSSRTSRACSHHFRDECLREIREQIPKTHLEAQKDFWEAKRAADHLEGTAEVALRGEIVPPMVPGQIYWRDTLPPGRAGGGHHAR